MSSIPYIKANDGRYTVIIENLPYVFDPSHNQYDVLAQYVLSGEVEDFLETFNYGAAIEDWSEGNFSFVEGVLYYKGEQVGDQPTDRIIGLMSSGWDCSPMLNYLDKLYSNVSNRAIKESYHWCSHKGLPITKNGNILGYKGVAIHSGSSFTDKLGRLIQEGDFVDKYTLKSYRNNIGDKNSMMRRSVCDDHTIGCSDGLHVGTYKYACDWAGGDGVVVLVAFNPKNIVSVPSCSDCQKIRVCSYKILDVAREQLDKEVYEDENEDVYEDGEVDGIHTHPWEEAISSFREGE